jgi:hypothetical protein
MFGAYRYRSRLEKLIRQWTDYRGLILTRMGSADVSASEERSFLKLKGQIAEGLASLTGKLSPTVAQDSHAHLRAMNSLLNRFPTLYAEEPISQQVRGEFEREWHDHFLFFNKLKGMGTEPETEDPRHGLPGGRAAEAKAMHRRSGGARFSTVLLRLLVVVALVWAVVMFVPWHLLRRVESDGGAKGFVVQSWDAVRATFSSMAGSILDPAVARWGSETTMVLVALFFIAIGYWIFIRMK